MRNIHLSHRTKLSQTEQRALGKTRIKVVWFGLGGLRGGGATTPGTTVYNEHTNSLEDSADLVICFLFSFIK